MNIQILLSSYLLTYMYGDLVFHNIFLLTREVLKKAYNDGLYYISSEKNIEDLINHSFPRKKVLVFSGIPSFEEVCMNLSPSKTIWALKMSLPYESLVAFTYQKKKESLVGNITNFENILYTKKKLFLVYEEGSLCYREYDIENSLLEHQKEIIHHFRKEIENYTYAIENKINFLRKSLFEYLETEHSRKDLEDEKKLKIIKESYEELMN